MERKRLVRVAGELELEDSSLQYMLDKLQHIVDLYPNEDLQVEYNSDSYGGYESLTVYYRSPETDEEFEARTHEEAKGLEKKERAELGRLASSKNLSDSNKRRLKELLQKYNPLGE